MRYELKVVFEKHHFNRVEHDLFNPQYGIREIFSKRTINNIYFDTLNFSDYYANVNGNSDREKYRIRWYGDLSQSIKRPTLERKYKKGILGGKNSVALPSFNFDEDFNYLDYKEKLIQYYMDSGEESERGVLNGLFLRQPVLVNTYDRKYYLTNDGCVRITLDFEMNFYSLATAKKGVVFPNHFDSNIVLEYKFEQENQDKAIDIINRMKYNVFKNSKYVNGIESIYSIGSN